MSGAGVDQGAIVATELGIANEIVIETVTVTATGTEIGIETGTETETETGVVTEIGIAVKEIARGTAKETETETGTTGEDEIEAYLLAESEDAVDPLVVVDAAGVDNWMNQGEYISSYYDTRVALFTELHGFLC